MRERCNKCGCSILISKLSRPEETRDFLDRLQKLSRFIDGFENMSWDWSMSLGRNWTLRHVYAKPFMILTYNSTAMNYHEPSLGKDQFGEKVYTDVFGPLKATFGRVMSD